MSCRFKNKLFFCNQTCHTLYAKPSMGEKVIEVSIHRAAIMGLTYVIMYKFFLFNFFALSLSKWCAIAALYHIHNWKSYLHYLPIPFQSRNANKLFFLESISICKDIFNQKQKYIQLCQTDFKRSQRR